MGARKADKTAARNQGEASLEALRTILKRCEVSGLRLDYPGEGGERPFRSWLVTDLLIPVLGWPTANVVVGERFDIRFRDGDGFPIATIETKAPGHRASKAEQKAFE